MNTNDKPVDNIKRGFFFAVGTLLFWKLVKAMASVSDGDDDDENEDE